MSKTTTKQVSCHNSSAEKKTRFEPIANVLERWEQHALFDISFNTPAETLQHAA